ncbi:MAG: hypothetical protein HWN67_15745 [Candidatus Helarchaeota archaeon]|nr:hypothetical protein [Candidatus Helarchaeota archaeon]
MDKKICKKCVDFKKLKSFDELQAVFHNWCSHSELPCALLSNCQKVPEFKNSVEFQNQIEKAYEALGKINPARFNNL